jgi:hypothetical protein
MAPVFVSFFLSHGRFLSPGQQILPFPVARSEDSCEFLPPGRSVLPFPAAHLAGCSGRVRDGLHVCALAAGRIVLAGLWLSGFAFEEL